MRCCIPVAIVVFTSGCVRLLDSSGTSSHALPLESGTSSRDDRARGDSDLPGEGKLAVLDRAAGDGRPRDSAPLKKDGTKPSQEGGAAVGCASWANYSCSGTLNSCTATCAGSLGANILLTCNVAMSVTCTCKINAVQLPTCTGIPFQGNCAACQAAVEAGCCQFH